MINTIDQNQRTLIILLASILMDFIGFGIVIPLLPFYAQSFGASALEVGILMGIFPLMGLFAPVLWGSLSDRLGRRPALLFNIAGTTLSYLWFSVANSLEMLLLARILAGVSSASIVIAQSYVSDITLPEHRTKTLGFLAGAGGIGFVIGPAIAGFLLGGTEQPNFHLPGFVATLASGITFCLALIALPRSRQPKIWGTKTERTSAQALFSLKKLLNEIKTTVQRPLIGVIMALGFVLAFAGMGIQAIFALWCEKRFGFGPQEFGYLIIFYCLVTAGIQIGLTGRIAHWLGEVKLLLWGLGAATLGLALISLSTTVPQLLGAMLFSVFAQATASPAATTLLSQLSGAKQQGTTLGLLQSVLGFGTCLGSIWAGFLFGAFGTNWPYWCGVMIMFGATLVAWQQITQSRLSAVIGRRRQQKFLHLFDLLDRDRSGTIELADFQQTAATLADLNGWQPETEEYKLLQTSLIGFGEMLQELADRDGNKRIDRAEWLHCLEAGIDYDFANVFLKIMDTNQDGKIALEELKTFYQAYGINTEEIDEAFHTLDLNQDGHISQEEFEKIFAQFLYSDDIQAPGNWIFGVSLPNRL